jgi:small-conductance mechanosensitive channel
MNKLLEKILFSIWSKDFTLAQIIVFVALSIIFFLTYQIITKYLFPTLDKNNKSQIDKRRSLGKLLIPLLVIGFVLLVIYDLKLDYTFEITQRITPALSLILKALFFLQFMRLLDWVINNLIIEKYFGTADNQINIKKLSHARRLVHYTFYVLVVIYFLSNYGLDFPIHKFKLEGGGGKQLRLSNVFQALLIFFIARLLIWVFIEIVLRNIYINKKIELGSQFAINQLVKYVIYIFAFVGSLDALGLNMTLLLGGAAALLVGVGLGLQSTFNDFISGIVLLFERSVSVGDVLEFDNTVGTVKKIGLRSSIVETRGNISIIVPNHLLVNEKVQNWTHFSDKVRFTVDVGVAYGSDTTLVKKLLTLAVDQNPYVLDYPAPSVRFESFGESSLDFRLYFFSRNYMVIEDIKSDIRLEIDRLFRKNKVNIPFPQRDVNLYKK